MAVDFDTISGVSNVYFTGKQAFNLMTGVNHLDTANLVDMVTMHLKQKIKELESTKNSFLAAFQCGSLSEFEGRVRNYYSNNNLMTFTGSSLKNIVNDFKAELNVQGMELQRQFEQLFQSFLNGYIQGPLTQEWMDALQGKEVSAAITTEIISEFIHMLNSLKDNGGLHYDVQVKRLTSGNDLKAALNLAANNSTTAFKKYISEIYNKALNGTQLSYTDRQGKQRNLQISTQKQLTQNSVAVSFGIKFANIIRSSGVKMLTKSELQEKLKRGEITKDYITKKNLEVVDLICSEVCSDKTYEKYVRNRLTEMLRKDEYMFFVGNSFTNLEGILGEVNAVIAISNLLGSRYTERALRWIGSQTGKGVGKQPSIDIVIDNLLTGAEKIEFGIQVKNTVDDLDTDIAHHINFADKNIDDILDQAGIGSENIKNVYVSDTYNVPYKRKGKKYRQVEYDTKFKDGTPPDFKRYVSIDKLIDELVESINIYLSRYAADLVYMAIPDFKNALATLDSQITGSARGNFVYIVGSKVYFANKMLEQLKSQLETLKKLNIDEERATLRISTYFKKEGEKGKNFNIVAAKNGEGELSQHSLKMKTSWGFS